MTSLDKRKMGLIAGIISAVAITVVAVEWMLPAWHSDPPAVLAPAGIAVPAPVLPPVKLAPPPMPAATVQPPAATASQPAAPAAPGWETANRTTLIKLLTDGHIYAAGNQPAKAIATYGLLSQLIGTNVIQDAALQTLLAQAAAERDQLARAQEEAAKQTAMVVQGTMSLARTSGDRVSPPTEVFLAKSDSTAARIMWALIAQVRKFDSANAVAQAKSDANDVAAFLPAELRSKHAAQQVIDSDIAIRKEALRDQDCLSARTDAIGNFAFTEIPPGQYYLAAMASLADQRMLWVLRIDKGDGPVTLTLDNDNALVVAIAVWSWAW